VGCGVFACGGADDARGALSGPSAATTRRGLHEGVSLRRAALDSVPGLLWRGKILRRVFCATISA